MANHDAVLAYLDKHYSSLEDIDRDALERDVESAQQNAQLLASKLEESLKQKTAMIESMRSDVQKYREATQELSLLRHNLVDDLDMLSKNLVSSHGGRHTLLENLETLQRNLQQMEGIHSYVSLIEHVLSLSEGALEQFKSSSSNVPTTINQSSLSEYEALQACVEDTKAKTRDIADTDDPLNVVVFLEEIRNRTWHEIKNVLADTLLSSAEALKWPSKVDYMSCDPDVRNRFEGAFHNLSRLQDLGREILPEDSEEPGLYPLQALTIPVALRFKYHFDGKRQTNRLDKPEWFFSHILNMVQEQQPFLESVIQPLLSRTPYSGVDAWREFTRLLLPILSRKLHRIVPQLLHNPPLLAHTIYQSLAFDVSLREAGFELSGTCDSSRGNWAGSSAFILDRQEWFDAWLEGEKKFSEDQYNDIISSPDAWYIADREKDNSTNNNSYSATNSARRVRSLVEQITDRYQPLPQFIQKTRFLITVQVPILESYHGRIASSLDAFETLSSSFVRAVPGALAGQMGHGVNTRQLTSGTAGVQRLMKALVSAKTIESAMEGWGEDLFFLELWTEIHNKAALRGQAEAHPSLPDPSQGSEVEGTIFQELVAQYNTLSARAEEMILNLIYHEIDEELRFHFNRVTSLHDLPSTENNTATATLNGPVVSLSTHLSFLQEFLPPRAVGALYRGIASQLAKHILQKQVLYKGQEAFTQRDGEQVLTEARLWIETCKLSLGDVVRRMELPWQELLDASALLALETETFRKLRVAGKAGITALRVALDDLGLRSLETKLALDILRIRTE